MCPICSQRIEGTGENDLSARLQEHLVSTHDFKKVCRLEKAQETEEAEQECLPSSSGKMADLTYTQERVQEGDKPQSEQLLPGEDIMESVRCPVCGETIFGHAPDDLSYNLSAHMDRVHDIRRRVLGRA